MLDPAICAPNANVQGFSAMLPWLQTRVVVRGDANDGIGFQREMLKFPSSKTWRDLMTK